VAGAEAVLNELIAAHDPDFVARQLKRNSHWRALLPKPDAVSYTIIVTAHAKAGTICCNDSRKR
jgi:hypothetical protein